MPDTPNVAEQQHQMFVRDENYESLYANNIQFHPSEWDLRLVFGELDLQDGKLIIEQHTSMAMPWLQAKLMLYFLLLQVGVYEMSHGKIPIPTTVMPPEPTPPEGGMKDDPFARRVYEYIKRTREDFFAPAG